MRVVIALPVLNEEQVLAATVDALAAFCAERLSAHDVHIVIADNGSTDRTPEIARALSERHANVTHLPLAARGKGIAVKAAWRSRDADVCVFMDADLAVDLAALPALIDAITRGADVAIGSRYLPQSVVERTALRKLLSRGYRAVVAALLETRATDLPCGFKAASARAVRELLPKVRDDRWFFDTELVVRAERAGFRVDEVPVTWRELEPNGRKSRVRIIPLVREYARCVAGLRRELGPRALPPVAPVAVDRDEKFLVAGVAALIVVLGAIPPLVAMRLGPAVGLVWNGRQFLSPGDFGVYLSYISQAAHGAFAFRNAATTEALVAVPNALWLAVGLLARAASLSPVAAFCVSRALLVPALAVAAYAFVAHLFRDRAARAVAFVTLMLGSGVGAYAAPFLRIVAPAAGAYDWPTDFWVAESNVFTSAVYSPHFIASWALFLLAALYLMRALGRASIRDGSIAGIAALALFQFHPFHAPTLYLLAAVALSVSTLSEGLRLRKCAAVAAFFTASLPSVAYHWWLTHASANAAFMLVNNVTVTPPLPYVALGIGIPALAAVAGVALESGGRTALLAPAHRRFLVAWSVINLLVIYLPFPFQRRLMEGLQFPLVMLSVPALVALWRSPRAKKLVAPAALALAWAALLLPSSFMTVARGIEAADPRSSRNEVFFFSPDQSAALDWIRDNTPRDAVVLAREGTSNTVIGWGERAVYAGHWANTIDAPAKLARTDDFFRDFGTADGARFLKAQRITHVLVGPDESALLPDGKPTPAYLNAVFSSGRYTVYRVVGNE